MEFSRQEYWSGLPFPSSQDLPGPGIEPGSPALEADPLPSEPPGRMSLLKTSFYYYYVGIILSGNDKHILILSDAKQE